MLFNNPHYSYHYNNSPPLNEKYISHYAFPENRCWKPPLDIILSADCVIFSLELPGLSSTADVLVQVKNDGQQPLLIIKGKYPTPRLQPENDTKTHHILQEGRKGYFSRILRFPVGHDFDFQSMQVEMERGVLNVMIPRKQFHQSKNSKIPIDIKMDSRL